LARPRQKVTIALLAALTAAGMPVAEPAAAHSFGTIYNLPVPFQMYAYGVAAALVVSFAILAYFAGVPRTATSARDSSRHDRRDVGTLRGSSLVALRTGSISGLALTVVAGFVGTQNALANINMTLFWVVFALGFYYITVLIGDLYSVINPWWSLCSLIDCFATGAFRARVQYPERFGYYPALALYFGYIWVELFAQTQPRSLAVILMVYTGVNLIASVIVGKDAWFRYGEFFSVLFRLAGMLAPIEYVPESDRGDSYRVRLRKPLVGVLERPADHLSLVLFVLFTLSSTAFDGIHETLPWVTIFWKHIYPLLEAALQQPYLILVEFYYYWQWLMLLASPFIYLLIYVFFLKLAKLAAGSELSARALMLDFAFSLVPIAFVYNVTHYYTMLASQGAQIVRLISDPFGFNWNLFGTSGVDASFIIDAGTVWHTQVALILLGHIIGVYLAHVEALRAFGDGRRALLSQLPMLLLMVLLTTMGLWILSLPIAAGQVVQPTTGG
jgi:hypothetical protein